MTRSAVEHWDAVRSFALLAAATPTVNSGLGQFGRLTIRLPVDDLELLFDWVDESYRAVAPRRLVAELGRHS